MSDTGIKTSLTNVNDAYMPLIVGQMEKNQIQMSAYSKECVLHAISAINAILSNKGIGWNDKALDKSNVADILMKVASFQLNAAASPREVYFSLRNVKQPDKTWKKQVEMGIEGDGNDSLLARFGRDVAQVGQFWKVREGDDFKYPSYNGLDFEPPSWTPKGQGKLMKVVYPIIKAGSDGNRYIEYYIAERADVIANLIAHISQNMMTETFGIVDDYYKASADNKKKIAARKKELLKKASDMGIDATLDDEELQPWISPAWTEYHSREAMIERKLRNNAIKKIPKDFANGALETMFEETVNETYRALQADIDDNMAKTPIDVSVTDTSEDTDATQAKNESDSPVVEDSAASPSTPPKNAPSEAPVKEIEASPTPSELPEEPGF